MAIVKKVEGPGIADRIAKGIGGVGKALSGIAGYQQKLEETKQKQEEWLLKKDLLKTELDQRKGDLKTMNFKSGMDLISQAIVSDDPEMSKWNLKAATEKLTAAGFTYDSEEMSRLVKVKGEKLRPVFEDIGTATNVLETQYGSMDEKEFSDRVSILKSSYDKVISSFPPGSVRNMYMEAKKEHEKRIAKMADQRVTFQQQKSIQGQKDAAAMGRKKISNPTVGEPGLLKSLGQAQGKVIAKQFDSQPKLRQQIDNLDNSLAIIDKVVTGPIAGLDFTQLLQRLTNEDAQALNFFMKKEQVKAIMDMAEKVGVRGIDTPKEQDRVISAIANPKMDSAVFQKALLSLKAAAKESNMIIDEKRQWLADGNTTMVGFKSSTSDKKAYVTPSGDIEFHKKEEAPEGLISIQDMWKKKGQVFDATQETPDLGEFKGVL